jgi:hypothetical protein
MSVEIEGLENVLDAFSNLADEQALKRAMGQACSLVVGDAIKKVKKGEGELQKHMQFRVEGTGNDIVGVVFNPLEYAPYVEYGTGMFAENGDGRQGYWVYVKDSEGGFSKKSKSGGKTYTLEEAKQIMAILRAKGLEAYYTNGRHPRPFLRPALHENRENILRILKGGLKSD